MVINRAMTLQDVRIPLALMRIQMLAVPKMDTVPA
jgi:hypothetical protein